MDHGAQSHPSPAEVATALAADNPVIPSMFDSFSQSAQSSSSLFGESSGLPRLPTSFTSQAMLSPNVALKMEDKESFTGRGDRGPISFSNISFSIFTRKSQIDRLLTQLAKDAIANSFDWKSIEVRRKKAKRKPTRSPPKPKSPFVTVKKFKIIVKKSLLPRYCSGDDTKASSQSITSTADDPIVDHLLSEQQSERVIRDQARRKQFMELYERLKRRDKYRFFLTPVDTKLVPDYLDVIQSPMDLGTIRKNILRDWYQNFDAFRNDAELMCRNCMTYNHPQTIFYQEAEAMMAYIDRIFCQAKRVFEPEETPPLIHPYETLDSSVMAVDEVMLRSKLSTDKRGCCDGTRCQTFADIGHFDVNKGHFDSLANDRAVSTECGPSCACSPETCLNRGVSQNRCKRSGIDIEKRNVYGIDAHTHTLIKQALSSTDGTIEEYSHFIENQILRYINLHVPAGTQSRLRTHMLHAMKALVADSMKADDTSTCVLAQSLLTNMEAGLSLPVYDKGHGVVCTNPNGFKKNEFIVEYIGEVYPPWRWFEKQAVVKQFQKVQMMPFSFGFYNILLERHKDDIRGYDVLFVDACRKGNFASRLSHSCSPNCTSVVIAADGRFAIVVLALRDIAPNEELTFDYHSVSESPDEVKNALCFCGWSKCRGRYVHFAGPDTFQQVLNVHHSFVHRTAILLRACSESVTGADRDRLTKWRLCGSVLDDLPEWAVKFAALVLEYIEYETTALPKELVQLSKFHYTQETAEFDTLGVTDSRIQCLAICLDKVKYILREAGNITDPPLRMLSEDDVIDRIWNSEDSVITSAAKKIGPHLDDVDLVRLMECTGAKVSSRQEMVSRLIEFRDLLRSMPSSLTCFHHVAADIVHMYAHTETFYCMTMYPTVKSPPLDISELGLNVASSADSTLLTPKPYTGAFIWGALMLWFNQTLDRPDAAAHSAKRGSVSLPSLEGCYASSSRYCMNEKYSVTQRDAVIAALQSKPVGRIPSHAIWDYRSINDRIYGSPMLDSLYRNKDLKPLIKGLQLWQPPADHKGVFELVQNQKRRRQRPVRLF